MRISYQAISDVGRKRKGNEDHFLVNPDQRLFVVADGMGGHAAGEVASRIAVDAIDEFVANTRDGEPLALTSGVEARVASEPDRIRKAIVYSNGMVFDATRERSEYEGMATTVAAVLVEGATAHLAHVGDSRVYLLRGATMKQMTRDHSWVNEQVESGILTNEQARIHPLRNVVTRALGGHADLAVDVSSLEVRAGDILLLCSDGLTTMVTDDEIASILQVESGDLAESARRLVDAANESGGEDNVTVVLVQFQS
jgi:serine/threonine protein phosphatase PrpC